MANVDQLGLFLRIFNNTTLTAGNTVNQLMPLFCQDVPNSANPQFPGVGITDHGPGFFGRSAVSMFFQQLFTTFRNMQWTYPPTSLPHAPQLFSQDGNTIGFQMDVMGIFQAPWFDSASGHASPPLSQLGQPTFLALGKRRGSSGGVPAFAVFTFDGSAQYLIKQIAIYMDRYAMMQSITHAGGWKPDAAAFDVVQSAERQTITAGAAHQRRITITIDG